MTKLTADNIALLNKKKIKGPIKDPVFLFVSS